MALLLCRFVRNSRFCFVYLPRNIRRLNSKKLMMNTEENILRKLGIEALSKMQVGMKNAMLERNGDVVLLSATGSGKTLAYLLPLVRMLDAKADTLQAVVIVPGRELALQSHEVFKGMGSGLRSMCLYGGRPTMDEHRELRRVMPQVVFATPGRLVDHLEKDNLNHYSVRYLVIDEFDKCLKMGFRDEMKRAVDMLPGVRRRFLLSATDAEEIPGFVNMRGVERLDYLEGNDVAERIGLFLVKSPDRDKLQTLANLLCGFGDKSTIVFLNYRDSAERVGEFLRDKGFVVSVFHGGLDQKQREDAVFRFSNGSANVLVATDLASRGLDMPDVDNIVHYHLPVGEDEYVHRVGRTARWKAEGRAFFLLGPDEELPEYVTDEPEPYEVSEWLGEAPQPRMATLYIGKGKHDKVSKGDVLGFLCKVGGLDGTDIGRIDVRERCSYAAVASDKWEDVVKRASGGKLKGVKTVVEHIK